MTRPLFWPVVALALAPLIFGCTQKNTGDEPGTASDVPAGIESFLLFPNPGVQTAGGYETNTDAYADAYYRAIDPGNAKDTLEKWKAQNGFSGSATPQAGTEHLVVFRDTKDLGYGRRMTGRRNSADGSLAFFVENYNVTPNSSGDYSSTLNVEAAIRRDTQWHVGTNAIEWSAAACNTSTTPPEDPANCDPTAKFAKFYNFSSANGTRQHFVNLDGRGMKAMPGPCITCHGGRGDPLTPDEGSPAKPRFPLVENSVSRKRGDVQARLHGMNVGSFGYSAQPGFSRAEQEAKLKDFNQWMLCSYPTAAPATVTGTWGVCIRPTAGANEWQGTAAELVEAWYGGAGMPQATFADSYVPAGWVGPQQALYTDVVAPYCRTCHILRGTANQSDLDFTTLAKFQGYADRIKSHVFDRGNMPLALIVYDDFWNSSAPQTLANFINPLLTPPDTVIDGSGAPLKPGRPIADPGPNRMVRTGANAILNGENSLFATSYSWTLISGSATITNPNSMVATFNAGFAGNHTVRLTVGNGAGTDSRDVVVTADDAFPDPLGLQFAHVKNVLQNIQHNGTTTCTSCHTSPPVSPTPPIFYNNFDRNGSGGAADATDEAWFLKALRGRANLTEIQASPLLRKPSGNHHNGGTLFSLATAAGLRNYSIFYNWILAGMPAGGVAANAVINGGTPVPALTFGGAFPGPYTASIPVDGSSSIGANSYFWSVVSGPNGPTGLAPSFANANAATTSFIVPNVGTYVVELQAGDGVQVDTDQRSITVSETPITASFTPPTGTTVVSFSGNPSRGNITLTSTSTGSPNTCRWVVSGPAGALLDGFASLDVTKTCGTAATLNVPATAIGGVYSVQLTASNIGGDSVTHSITVGNGTPVVANIVANSGINPVIRTFTGGNPATGAASTATLSLNGNGSSGVLPLTFAWSITGPSTSQPDVTNGPASLSSTIAAAPTLTVRATGSYTVRLQVTDAASNVAATTSTFSVTPTNGTTFATMTGLFVSIGCTGCHSTGVPAAADPANNSGTQPSWQNVNDVNGKTLWRRVFQRIAVGAPASSLLLLNPQNVTNGINTNGHGGLCQPGFGCDATGSANATTFSNWISSGGPPGN